MTETDRADRSQRHRNDRRLPLRTWGGSRRSRAAAEVCVVRRARDASLRFASHRDQAAGGIPCSSSSLGPSQMAPSDAGAELVKVPLPSPVTSWHRPLSDIAGSEEIYDPGADGDRFRSHARRGGRCDCLPPPRQPRLPPAAVRCD